MQPKQEPGGQVGEKSKGTDVIPDKTKSAGTKKESYDKWCWVVEVAGFLIIALQSIALVANSYFYLELLETFPTQPTALVAGTLSLYNGARYLCGPVVAIILRKTSHKFIAVLGGIFIGAGVTLIPYMPHIALTYLCSGLAGTGAGMASIATFTLLPSYFTRSRAMALAVVNCGFGVGFVAGPPLINFLLREFGFKGSAMIVGATMLHICAAGLVFRPTRTVEEGDGAELYLSKGNDIFENISFVGSMSTFHDFWKSYSSIGPAATGGVCKSMEALNSTRTRQKVDSFNSVTNQNVSKSTRSIGGQKAKATVLLPTAEEGDEATPLTTCHEEKDNSFTTTRNWDVAPNKRPAFTTTENEDCMHPSVSGAPKATRDPADDDFVPEVNFRARSVSQTRRIGNTTTVSVTNGSSKYKTSPLVNADNPPEPDVEKGAVGKLKCPDFCGLTFILALIALSFYYMGVSVVNVLIPALARERHLSAEHSSIVLNVVGATDIASMILMAFVLDSSRFAAYSTIIYGGFIVYFGVVVLLLGLVEQFPLITLFAGLQSLVKETIYCQLSGFVADVFGLETMTHVYGIFLGSMGISSVSWIFISGALRDELGSYSWAFVISGGVTSVAAVLLFIQFIFVLRRNRSQQTTEL